MENNDQKKAEDIIEKKIYVIPYVLSNDPYIDTEDWEKPGLLISDNQESLEEYAEEWEGEDREYCIELEDLIEMGEYEARERYGDAFISTILGYDGYVNNNDDDYDYSETYMSIEELRDQRAIESEPFDAKEIISKIASEYVITPRRKASLIEIINKLL